MEGLGAISLTTVPAFELPRYRITKRGALEPTEVLQVRRESEVYREGGFTKALERLGDLLRSTGISLLSVGD